MLVDEAAGQSPVAGVGIIAAFDQQHAQLAAFANRGKHCVYRDRRPRVFVSERHNAKIAGCQRLGNAVTVNLRCNLGFMDLCPSPGFR